MTANASSLRAVTPSRPEVAAIKAVIHSIPRGRVTNYGDVANRAGLPRRGRLVGRILRDAPATEHLPWHRVIRAGGRLAFATGSEAYHAQVRRLREEGVAVVRGRIDLLQFGWQQDADAVLWGPPAEH
ncbi:MAG: MGMT family protein [Dokdonella sp.]